MNNKGDMENDFTSYMDYDLGIEKEERFKGFEDLISSDTSNLPALKEETDSSLVSVDSHILQRYLAEINKYPLLTREEEDELTRLYYETKDPEIAKRLVTSNLRLVVKIALDFQRYWMQNFLDLIQEGNLGLIQAVKKFDPFKGVKFSYYASFWIKAYLLKFIMDNWRLVKIGTTQTQRKLFYNLNKEKERLYALGFEPATKLLSDRLNVPEHEIIEMDQRLLHSEMSLDASITEDSEEKFLDFLPSNDEPIDEVIANEEIKTILKDKIADFVKTLSEKERIVFEKRLYTDEPMTLNELGNEFNVSRERIRQIETKLKTKLKEFLKKQIPDIENYLSNK